MNEEAAAEALRNNDQNEGEVDGDEESYNAGALSESSSLTVDAVDPAMMRVSLLCFGEMFIIFKKCN